MGFLQLTYERHSQVALKNNLVFVCTMEHLATKEFVAKVGHSAGQTKKLSFQREQKGCVMIAFVCFLCTNSTVLETGKEAEADAAISHASIKRGRSPSFEQLW